MHAQSIEAAQHRIGGIAIDGEEPRRERVTVPLTVAQAVAEYTTAVANEGAAFAAWSRAAPLASEACGGEFSYQRDVGVMWSRSDGRGPYLVSGRRCPSVARQTAEQFGLHAIYEALEATQDERELAVQQLAAAPCMGEQDVIAKFAASLIERDWVVCGEVDEVMAKVTRIVQNIEESIRNE